MSIIDRLDPHEIHVRYRGLDRRYVVFDGRAYASDHPTLYAACRAARRLNRRHYNGRRTVQISTAVAI